MIRVFIILLLIVALAIMYYIYETKIIDYKRDLTRQTKQFYNLKEQYNTLINENKIISKNLKIKSVPLSSTNGITNENIALRLAPLENSNILNIISTKSEVLIYDEVMVDTTSWFYVSIPSLGNINSKGWINKRDFSLIISSSKEIIRS